MVDAAVLIVAIALALLLLSFMALIEPIRQLLIALAEHASGEWVEVDLPSCPDDLSELDD